MIPPSPRIAIATDNVDRMLCESAVTDEISESMAQMRDLIVNSLIAPTPDKDLR
jgi:hypothetical protein